MCIEYVLCLKTTANIHVHWCRQCQSRQISSEMKRIWRGTDTRVPEVVAWDDICTSMSMYVAG